MKAHMEHLASVIRVGRDGFKYGDPYTFSATVKWISTEEVEIVGALRAPTMSEYKAFFELCKEIGIKTMIVTRIKNGQVIRLKKRIR